MQSLFKPLLCLNANKNATSDEYASSEHRTGMSNMLLSHSLSHVLTGLDFQLESFQKSNNPICVMRENHMISALTAGITPKTNILLDDLHLAIF